MKILALMTDAFGGYGGIAQYNRDLLTALAALPGAEITVLPRIAERGDPAPAPIRQLAPIKSRAGYAMAALRLVQGERPDLIFNGHLYHGSLALMLSRRTGATLISQLHGTEIWSPVRPAHLEPLVRSRLVFCVSRDTRARYLDQTTSGHDNTIVIPNTVGPAFHPGDRKAARARFGLGDAFAILTVARLDTREGYKGHDRVLRALPGVLQVRPDCVYLIAGAGDDRARLESLATSLGVAHAVRFPGKVPVAELPDLYRAADLFALPSTGEGFGIVFLEAMACGTPAIGLNVGGAPDALGDGDLGLCVSPEDFPSALIDAVSKPAGATYGLADRVRRRFGRPVFEAAVRRAIARAVGRDAPSAAARAGATVQVSSP